MLEERELGKESWPKLFLEVAHSLNTIPNSGTGVTPYKIMCGVDPRRSPLLDHR